MTRGRVLPTSRYFRSRDYIDHVTDDVWFGLVYTESDY